MTAILALCGAGALPQENVAAEIFHAMRPRGEGRANAWSGDRVRLASRWYEWEEGIGGGVPGIAVSESGLVVAADASLYYQDELAARLDVSLGDEACSGRLIAAGYDRWGDDVLEYLEGDFAFALWDPHRSRLLAARHIAGRRALYYAEVGTSLVLASSIEGLLAHPSVPDDLDLVSIAEVAAGSWAFSPDTCYVRVKELLAGRRLTWEPSRGIRVEHYWTPPRREDRPSYATGEAAEELRNLLEQATLRRMAPSGPSFVSLSGGWDSTAVYGAGKSALGSNGGGGRSLKAVSISYPEGDSGREDELIRLVLAHWSAEATWLDIADLPVFAGRVSDPSRRVQPWVHVFENWNRGLASAARDSGSRVLLDGVGGDQFFQVSVGFVADLVRSGRLLEAYRQWRSFGAGNLRGFVRWGVLPTLPDRLARGITRLARVQPPTDPWAQHSPSWIRADSDLMRRSREREREHRPRLNPRSAVAAETELYLLYPYFSRVMAEVYALAMAEGVEARAPLMDDRIMRLAFHRPWYERANRRETKVLLRLAMRGLLPDDVLAPRPHRTGTTSDYLVRSLRSHGGALVEATRAESPLARAGVLDTGRLEHEWKRFGSGGGDGLGIALFLTLQTDAWLRSIRAHDRQTPL